MSSYAISSFDPTSLLQPHTGPTIEAPPTPSTGVKDEQLRSLGQWNFAVGGERIMCCGFWDHSVKCYGLDNGFKLQANTCGGHRGAINCLQLGEDNVTLVTGAAHYEQLTQALSLNQVPWRARCSWVLGPALRGCRWAGRDVSCVGGGQRQRGCGTHDGLRVPRQPQ